MKSILEIVKEFGLEIPEDKKKEFEKSVLENYKTVAEVEKKDASIKKLQDDAKVTKEALEKFNGVDPTALTKQIEDLKTDLAAKETEFQTQLSDRDFSDNLNSAISQANGKNAKAIMALLDQENLKASKNQKEDIANAIKSLTEADDSKMLFGEAEPTVVNKGNPIGAIGGGGITPDAEDIACRKAMGLPPVKVEGDK